MWYCSPRKVKRVKNSCEVIRDRCEQCRVSENGDLYFRCVKRKKPSGNARFSKYVRG